MRSLPPCSFFGGQRTRNDANISPACRIVGGFDVAKVLFILLTWLGEPTIAKKKCDVF